MRKKTTEEFKKEVFDLEGDLYTVKSNYESSSKKIIMSHNECGMEYSVSPNSFLKGRRCPNCNGNKAKQKTTESYKKEVYELVNDEYTVLGEYINRPTPILMRHNKCGREYKVSPGNFLYSSRCVQCYYEDSRLDIEVVTENISKHLGTSYKLVSEYKGADNKVDLLHRDCGKVTSVRYTDIIQHHSGCKYCNKSRGEEYVESFLTSKGIKFEEQKKFKDLKNIHQLSYDFYLPEYDILIEYQGTQHFIPKTFGNITKEEAIIRLKKQQVNDKIKRDYATTKGYTLIEPTYKLDNYTKVYNFLEEQFTLLEVKQGILNLN